MWGNKQCDNAGGCHFDDWTPGCEAHGNCRPFFEEDWLAAAIDTGEPMHVRHALAMIGGWAYNAGSRSLTLKCRGIVIARFAIPATMNLSVGREGAGIQPHLAMASTGNFAVGEEVSLLLVADVVQLKHD